MNVFQLSNFNHARHVFDHLTEEVHFWEVIRDAQGEIQTWKLVYANDSALKTWGFALLKEIFDKTTDEIFGEGATKHYLPVVKKIFKKNKPHVYRDYFPNIKRYFRFTSVPLDNYFITTGWDITDITEDNISLEDDKRILQKHLRYTDEFELKEIKRSKEMELSNQSMSDNISSIQTELEKNENDSFYNYKKIFDLVLKQSELVQKNAQILNALNKARMENQKLRQMLDRTSDEY